MVCRGGEPHPDIQSSPLRDKMHMKLYCFGVSRGLTGFI